MDYFSRYCELVPVPNRSVTKAFHELILRCIAPVYFSCDNGTEFQNDVMDNLCKIMKITLTIQSAFNSTFYSSLGDTAHFLRMAQTRDLLYDLFQTRCHPEYSDSYAEYLLNRNKIPFQKAKQNLGIRYSPISIELHMQSP